VVLPVDTIHTNVVNQGLAELQYAAVLNLLTALLMMLSLYRLLRFLSIYQQISSFYSLLQQVFQDMLSFLVFYVCFLMVIGMTCRIFRQDANADAYPLLENQTYMLIIDAFRNSIGDIQTPTYSLWEGYDKRYDELGTARPFFGPLFMIYIIYAWWIFSSVFLLVLYLNIIIGIIT
jgi:hypothetical protein